MDFQVVVIGGGIVGLAVGARLSQLVPTLVLERHPRLLQETSSRNSGVIHAGIYYPHDSLKTSLCIEGNRNLWRLVSRGAPIKASKIGKWIGATTAEEVEVLRVLAESMARRGLPWEWLPKEAAAQLEPNVAMQAIVHSPSTGIVDPHSLGEFFEAQIANSSTGSRVVCNCCVTGVHFDVAVDSGDGSGDVGGGVDSGRGLVRVETQDGSAVHCAAVVNAMGLSAPQLHCMCTLGGRSLGPCPAELRLHYCKGRYVSCRRKIVSRLVYPCPLPNLQGLGVHSVVGLDGSVRFGPDAVYVDNPDDLDVARDAEQLIDASLAAVQRYIPSLSRDDLSVDYAGMRPKLSGAGEPFRDFVIRREPVAGRSASPLITLAGIESPGLTACTAIADRVAEMLCLGDGPRAPWSP